MRLHLGTTPDIGDNADYAGVVIHARHCAMLFQTIHNRWGSTTAPVVQQILDRVGDWLVAAKILGTGGGYFRLFPEWLVHQGIRLSNAGDVPPITYLHPQEFDSDRPRLHAGLLRRLRLTHYVNLGKTEDKLPQLLGVCARDCPGRPEYIQRMVQPLLMSGLCTEAAVRRVSCAPLTHAFVFCLLF